MKTGDEIAIVGAGKLGSALALALSGAGYGVREIIVRDDSPNKGSAQRLARRVGAQLSLLNLAKLDAKVTWICVSDDAIAAMARRLAERPNWRGKIAMHSSGALSSEELAPLKRRGAAVGSAHPMMTFANHAPIEWKGIPFAVEGDPAAVAFAQQVARKLNLDSFRISARSKPLYHAVGSFASPILVGLLSTAERIARAAGISKPPRTVIDRILRRTIDHYLKGGTAAAFSGPMQRGDLATVKRHLENLRRVPGALEIYLLLATELADNLPVKRRAELKRLLRSAGKQGSPRRK
jgi:predicted short-subunit dehydrogenase-like oxidoreductase (DUF2520 family)